MDLKDSMCKEMLHYMNICLYFTEMYTALTCLFPIDYL